MKSPEAQRAARLATASFVLVAALVASSLLGGALEVPSVTAAPPAGESIAATPSAAAVDQARDTTAVLTNALVAAVVSISDTVPPGASADDIDAGSAAVSALVPGRHGTYRLIDATGDPIDHRNHPFGSFEFNGLMQLVAAPFVEQVIGNRLRTLVPLTNDMHPNCATCHTGYGALPPGTVVGAASFRIKL